MPVAELVHATDNPHADLFVRICEVQKSGRSIKVSDGFRRLKPHETNGTIQLEFEAMAHRFTPGTRIRLQVSGARIRDTPATSEQTKIRPPAPS